MIRRELDEEPKKPKLVLDCEEVFLLRERGREITANCGEKRN